MRRHNLILSCIVPGLIAAGITGCQAPPTPAPVIVYGDSLTVQSETAATAIHPKEDVIWRAENGTALCDWVTQAKKDAATLHPQRIVLAFVGNSATCAKAWAEGGDPAATAVYEKALREFRDIWPHTSITVVLPPACHNVKPPYFWPFAGSPMLTAMYRTVGHELGMTINTRADDWLTPHHVYRSMGPAFLSTRRVQLRTSEGVHLTAAGTAWYGAALLAG